MTQWALPDANVLNELWVQGAGDGDADFWDELDEGFGAGRGSGAGPDDATTYWSSPSSPNNADLTTGLSAVTDPQVGTGHNYRTRNRKNAAAGKQIDISIFLSESGTTRASQNFVNIGDTWTTRDDPLSTAEADAITNYANLEIDTQATAVGGGAARFATESAHEFECPDAPAVAPTPPPPLIMQWAMSRAFNW